MQVLYSVIPPWLLFHNAKITLKKLVEILKQHISAIIQILCLRHWEPRFLLASFLHIIYAHERGTIVHSCKQNQSACIRGHRWITAATPLNHLHPRLQGIKEILLPNAVTLCLCTYCTVLWHANLECHTQVQSSNTTSVCSFCRKYFVVVNV